MNRSIFQNLLLRDAYTGVLDEEYDVLIDDLMGMSEEGFEDEQEAYHEWLRRLGGPGNIPKYAATLLTQRFRMTRGASR